MQVFKGATQKSALRKGGGHLQLLLYSSLLFSSFAAPFTLFSSTIGSSAFSSAVGGYSSPVNDPELVAFAPEAFEAFMQPIPLTPKPTVTQAGVSVVSDSNAKPYRPGRSNGLNSIGQAHSRAEQIFVAADFDSPFHISYSLEYLEAVLDESLGGDGPSYISREFIVDASFEEDISPFEDLDIGPEKVAMLSRSDVIKINDELLFADQKTVDVNPPTFSYGAKGKDAASPLRNEQDKSQLLLRPAIKVVDKSIDISRQLARDNPNVKATLIPTFPEPSLRLELDSFYIDRWPVTNAEYKQFVEEKGVEAPSHWVNGNVPEEALNKPVVNVNYENALAYAAWAGKRLPTELEWGYAAQEPSFSVSPAHREWVETSFTAGPTRPTYHPNSDKYRLITGTRSGGLSILHEKDSNSHTTFRCVKEQ